MELEFIVVCSPSSVAFNETKGVLLSILTDVNVGSVLVRFTVAVPIKSLMRIWIMASMVYELFAA